MRHVVFHYFVYILASKKNGTLYIGVTNNLGRCVFEHKHDLVSGFTKKYSVHTLVYYEIFEDINKAIEREKQIKAGASFSSVLKTYPDLFPNLYISLVKSGEASGKLSEILLRLADNLEKQREFKGKLNSTLTYSLL